MILTGPEIAARIGKDILIDPFESRLLNPNSYNLRLHHELLVYSQDSLDMRLPNPTHSLPIPQEGLVLEPGRLYLGRTLEYTETHNLVPMLEGRSSVGRLGMSVHITAGFGDVGFCGYWTLEIHTLAPIRVYAGIAVCQIFYHTVQGPIVEYDSDKYQKNTSIQASFLYKDFEQKAQDRQKTK